MMTPNDAWLNLLSPTIRFPVSGDLDFTYFPYTKWEAPAMIRGDDRVELRAYTEVASPGRQLGKITEVVLQLSEKLGLDTKEVKDLKTFDEQISDIKKSVKDRTADELKMFLEKLSKKSPTLLRELLREYESKGPNGGAE